MARESLEALRHLSESLGAGRPWHLALLEAIGMWTSPQEVFQGRQNQYLIQHEAFDLFALARRLGEEVADSIPQAEWQQFSLHGRLPQDMDENGFRALLGGAKFTGLLNYWYGVALEGALQAAVRDEVRKERLGRGIRSQAGLVDQAFQRIYGEPRSELLQRFRQADGARRLDEPAYPKAFTYWLFKLRVDGNEKAKVASDTRKALLWLQRRHPEPLYGLLQSLALLEAVVGDGVEAG